MNNKGQIGILGVIFGLLVFFVIWGMFLASWITDISQDMITNNSLTGMEAFLIANLNLWVVIGVLFAALVLMYFGGSR